MCSGRNVRCRGWVVFEKGSGFTTLAPSHRHERCDKEKVDHRQDKSSRRRVADCVADEEDGDADVQHRAGLMRDNATRGVAGDIELIGLCGSLAKHLAHDSAAFGVLQRQQWRVQRSATLAPPERLDQAEHQQPEPAEQEDDPDGQLHAGNVMMRDVTSRMTPLRKERSGNAGDKTHEGADANEQTKSSPQRPPHGRVALTGCDPMGTFPPLVFSVTPYRHTSPLTVYRTLAIFCGSAATRQRRSLILGV